ncbi:hypothetical protein [Streptomyces sp. NBC_00576]|uniref:hypothetical protein n=1 Tax=Streptomyces sp. NBC_00576 TaxID=2903665 RepID=UPI002E823B97|nr:hypothetical protein [Streptomyces sp. NBC_00576]WUB73099.1 hypothetical protein OG734_25105 [Streptomyces sp. NBC_00576]
MCRPDRGAGRGVAAAVGPLFVLLLAASYFLLERATPGSFTEPLTRTDALYFAPSGSSQARRRPEGRLPALTCSG